jgi:hypothetical protein
VTVVLSRLTPAKEVSAMGISPRMRVALSGMVLAGAAVTTLGAAAPANAQSVTVAPRHATAGYSVINKHRHWRSGSYTYTYDRWSWWGGCGCDCGCGCC